MTVAKPTYVVILRGLTSADIVRKVSEAHATAVQSAKSKKRMAAPK